MTDLVDPETGLKVEVVDAGSPNDPFAPKTDAPSAAAQQVVAPSAQPPVNAQAPAGGKPEEPAPELQPEPKPAVDAGAAPAPAAGESTTEEWSPEELEALQKLNEFFETNVAERTSEALRNQQSGYDKRINQLQQTIDQSKSQAAELQKQIRELQIQGMPEAEQARLRAHYEQEDRTAALNEREQAMDEWHRELFVTSLVLEFNQFGVTEAQLTECESPEDMEALCLEAKANYYEALANGKQPAPAAPTAAKPAAPVAQPAQKAPAGASAPSDVGGGGKPGEEPTFRTDTGPDALLANLRNSKVTTIRVR